MEALVLGRRVEMTGAGARYELDLLTHGSGLLLISHALGAKVRDHLFDTALLDGAQAARRHAQAHEAALAFHPEAMYVQVRQKPATPLVVRVRDAIPGNRALAGDFTHSGHDVFPQGFGRSEEPTSDLQSRDR